MGPGVSRRLALLAFAFALSFARTYFSSGAMWPVLAEASMGTWATTATVFAPAFWRSSCIALTALWPITSCIIAGTSSRRYPAIVEAASPSCEATTAACSTSIPAVAP
eukprot:CAMPEP_0172734194 /NCGR_PEP_ID=MMETSP1074-20121228/109262_1 /TAXON_ID=2916 /ORGANISM="Ceratium fusus, Strain PA161109" /LENGTH=107 /DNA_ID=CAMNT_0013562915 /DNA_START=113 /DNA_END=436 /DNA_ORIENTATION=+